MPELPEVETVCRGLKPHLLRKTIVKIEVIQPKLRYRVDKDIHKQLTGQTVQDIRRRAKYILLQLDNNYLIIHLGMSGTLNWHEKTQELSKHDHVAIQFTDGVLHYNDPRRFGCILVTNRNYQQHKLLANLGPEPLTEQFNDFYLYKQARNKNKVIKSFIMDNAVVVGVGNIYANEALFASSIHPATPAKNLSLEQFTILVSNIKIILKNAIAKGGTTLQDFASVNGKLGYFAQDLQVYGRAGKECVKCNHVISQIVLNQRNSFFCDNCQI